MRTGDNFDALLARDHGPATDAVRAVVSLWAAIDWFVPTDVDSAVAVACYRDHLARRRAAAPDLFVDDDVFSVDARVGGRSEFDALCARFRPPQGQWDWKLGPLRKMSQRHTTQHNWSLAQFLGTPECADLGVGDGLLFWSVGNTVNWTFNTTLEPDPGVPPPTPTYEPAAADWYFRHAVDDLTSCLQWQLAAGHSEMEENPFLPLVQLHHTGHNLFVFKDHRITLFAFGG